MLQCKSRIYLIFLLLFVVPHTCVDAVTVDTVALETIQDPPAVTQVKDTSAVAAEVDLLLEESADPADSGAGSLKSSMTDRARSLLGIFVFLGLCFLLSTRKSDVNWRTIIWGVALQFTLGILILKTAGGARFTAGAKDVFWGILKYSEMGTGMVFGTLPSVDGVGFQLWIVLLGTIIFVSAVMAVLYHIGVLQFVVWCIARVMQKTMGTSGPESLAAAANIFAGQTEAPLVIRPYLKTMTDSEVMALMTGGMATVAGSVFAAYVGMGVDPGHLLAASFMSAPAALMAAKLLIPEDPKQKDDAAAKFEVNSPDTNVLDAACRGSSEGLMLALNVIAMLIAFVAMVALINGAMDWAFNGAFNLTIFFSYFFYPFAWLLGVDQADVSVVASLIGMKTVLNEFVAFLSLTGDMGDSLSERSKILTTYALCGFANFASVAIQIGGISSLEPKLRPRLAALGLKALLGGTIAALVTGCVVGVIL